MHLLATALSLMGRAIFVSAQVHCMSLPSQFFGSLTGPFLSAQTLLFFLILPLAGQAGQISFFSFNVSSFMTFLHIPYDMVTSPCHSKAQKDMQYPQLLKPWADSSLVCKTYELAGAGSPERSTETRSAPTAPTHTAYFLLTKSLSILQGMPAGTVRKQNMDENIHYPSAPQPVALPVPTLLYSTPRHCLPR